MRYQLRPIPSLQITLYAAIPSTKQVYSIDFQIKLNIEFWGDVLLLPSVGIDVGGWLDVVRGRESTSLKVSLCIKIAAIALILWHKDIRCHLILHARPLHHCNEVSHGN